MYGPCVFVHRHIIDILTFSLLQPQDENEEGKQKNNFSKLNESTSSTQANNHFLSERSKHMLTYTLRESGV